MTSTGVAVATPASTRSGRAPYAPGMSAPSVVAAVVDSLEAIAPAAWNACANPPDSDSQYERFNPFISHEFLSALERSGSAGGRSGWRPLHLTVRDEAGGLLAAAPCYLKSHSQGEYVFDHAWAEAYARAGGRYYPKLQVAVPFTPVTGRRLLVAPGPRRDEARAILLRALAALPGETGASSLHVTFPDAADADALEAAGFLRRTGEQFHFFNEGYRCYDDFLAALGIFILVVLATFPVVLPFALLDDAVTALRVSNGIALVMLFGAGYALGRFGRHRPIRTGLVMTGIGVGLVAITIALGG